MQVGSTGGWPRGGLVWIAGGSFMRHPTNRFVVCGGLVLLTASLLLWGVQRSRTIASSAGGAGPFRQLDNLPLNATAGALEERRPGDRPEAYVGYSEQVEQYEVLYYFPGVAWDEQQVPPSPGTRVEQIVATRSASDARAALQLWRQEFSSAASRLPHTPECFGESLRGSAVAGVPVSSGQIYTAVWNSGVARSTLESLPARHGAPPGVRLAVERKRPLAALIRWTVLRPLRRAALGPEPASSRLRLRCPTGVDTVP